MRNPLSALVRTILRQLFPCPIFHAEDKFQYQNPSQNMEEQSADCRFRLDVLMKLRGA